jgi:general secretion pathway protein E
MTTQLGKLLTDRGLIRPADLVAALRFQTANGGLLGTILVRMGAIAEEQLLAVLSEQLRLPVQGSATLPGAGQVQAFLDETGIQKGWWLEHQAVGWRDDDQVIHCTAVNPFDGLLRGSIEQAAEGPVQWRLGSRSQIAAAWDVVGDSQEPLSLYTGEADARRLRELAEEAPVIDFVNTMFAEALQKRASDIHIEPFEDRFCVRLRIDGILHLVRTAQRAEFDAVSSRIKLLSGMDVADRRLPQDGRQTIRLSGQDVDLRVSTLPSTWGESLVVRLLGKASRLPDLGELGLAPEDARALTSLVDQPNGIVLVTGPTGSGKTTTIYRLLTALNDGHRKIVTVEDPVEFDLPGVVQVQTKSDIGFTFAAGLRSILRQDPDVIMVGEIRDSETARIAVQAALTGHMVISTVHTNSAFAAVSRLLDLGIEDYLLADVLRGLTGQRLVRRLCPHCSVPSDQGAVRQFRHVTPDAVRDQLGAIAENWREPSGCDRCSSGFATRLGVYEIAEFTPDLATAVRRRASESDLLNLSRQNGFRTMFEDGFAKAATGLTSLREIYRVIGAGEPTGRSRDDPLNFQSVA